MRNATISCEPQRKPEDRGCAVCCLPSVSLCRPAAVADADALNSRSLLCGRRHGSCGRGGGGTGRPVARDIVEWTRLRRGGAAFDDYVAFLDRNPDWPGLPYLRAQGEPSLPRGGDAERVIAYFGGQAPRTGMGALALANAL
jgi:soluble lytic murein transglycosylase